MSDRTHSFVYGRGEAQATRALPALDPSSARVDERGLPEMLAYLAEFARLVGFVDDEGRPAGDWSPFFERDASFLLAQVCATTADSVVSAASASQAADGDQPAGDAGAYRTGTDPVSRDSARTAPAATASLENIFAIARRIDTWYRMAGQLSGADGTVHPFELNLDYVIGNDLSRYTRAIDADKTLGPAWRRMAERANVTLSGKWQSDSKRSLSFSLDDLVPVEAAFRRSLEHIVALARSYLESTQGVSGSDDTQGVQGAPGTHAPHTGLLIAFVKLLGVVQDELNQFTDRHLQYYLRDVLRLAPRPSQPDRTLVAFTLAPNARSVLLEAGCGLAAGVDASGAPIVFATQAPLVVTPATVESLMSLKIGYADLDGDTRAQAATGEVPITSVVAYPNAASADGRGAPLADPASGWPTFGLSRDDALAAGNPAPDAPVGFVIASPLLLLAGGERTITLSFEFDNEAPAGGSSGGEEAGGTGSGGSGAGPAAGQNGEVRSAPGPGGQPSSAQPPAAAGEEAAIDRLTRLATRYANWLAAESDEPAMSASELLEGLMGDACLVFLSGAQGWFAPQSARLALGEGGTLDLVIELSATAPAVLANTALALDESKTDNTLPMLKVVMNPSAPVYGYSFFEALRARRARLAVSVRGLRTLDVQSSLGPLVPTKPFMPFGPAPILGSYLQIGTPELACKPVTHIGVELDWINLPAGGFADYYRGYPPNADGQPIGLASFLAVIERNDGVAWRPASRARTARFGLYTPAASTTPELAASSTRFDFDTALGTAPATFESVSAPAGARGGPRGQSGLPVGEQAGALRITLAAPSGAFGYDVYSRALADAVLANARAGRNGSAAALPPIPSPPYVPMATSVSLDYSAEATVALDRLEDSPSLHLYALAPFGYLRVGPGGATPFVPRGTRGALCIGLAGISPGDTLSLLFQLVDRHTPQTIDFTREDAPQSHADAPDSGRALSWYYLTGNVWTPFEKRELLSDSTYGLTCSGIVQFVLPAQLDGAGTLMPGGDGRVWIAAVAFDELDAVGNTIQILPNAVTVARVTGGETVVANVPPQSITGLVTKLPAIKAVAQPLASSGGLPAETPQAFAMRVAERLHHKQRAIQPYDYERLVLGSFADIAQAKCVGPGNSRGYAGTPALAAGEVVLVVAARLTGQSFANVPQQTLRAVLDVLKPYVSPFLRRLTVRNPLYERVKVVAAVRLKPKTSGTFYLNQLSSELDAALAPWRSQAAGRLPIGYGAIDGNSVASFIRQRDYVLSLEEFHLEVLYDVSPDSAGDDWRERWLTQDDVVRPSTPWSVLVPAQSHLLVQVDGHDGGDKDAPDLLPAGIGSLTIGDDFVAAPSAPAPLESLTPARQTVYYVKFLDRMLRDGRRRGHQGPHGREEILIEDAFIEFPDRDDAEPGARGGSADSPDAPTDA